MEAVGRTGGQVALRPPETGSARLPARPEGRGPVHDGRQPAGAAQEAPLHHPRTGSRQSQQERRGDPLLRQEGGPSSWKKIASILSSAKLVS